MITQFANKLWLLSQRSNYKRFLRDRNQLAKVQSQKLETYLKENQNTHFGKKNAFGKITNYADYIKAVPIVEDYQQISPLIERMMLGEQDVLFKGKALFFESTSGSSGQAKYIPYNQQLKSELDTAISAWMWNLYQIDPKIFNGTAYWSLSPALKKDEPVESKTQIGTESDLEYFNPIAAILLKQIMAVNQPSDYKDTNDFYVQTWKQLLKNKNLSFISVWSPQFLLRLMEFLKANQAVILSSLSGSSSRQKELQSILEKDILKLSDLFPHLRLISCWTQAQSAIWQAELKNLAGDIPIQGKGLLSTEGVVSIPWGMDQQVLAYQAHFYEFKGVDDQIYLAHQLQEGSNYECIITTGAGLYRYNTHDLVQCTGFIDGIPALEFLGRTGNVSDMVGEKITEHSLTSLFLEVKRKYSDLKSIFLFPHKKGLTAEYWLLISGLSDLKAKEVCDLVHQELLQNPYYKQAVQAGQLNSLEYKTTNEQGIELLSRHYQKMKNIKDGDLKLPLLFPIGFWEKLKKE